MARRGEDGEPEDGRRLRAQDRGAERDGRGEFQKARSSSGVKSPSGPTKMPSDAAGAPSTTAATSFQIGGGGG